MNYLRSGYHTSSFSQPHKISIMIDYDKFEQKKYIINMIHLQNILCTQMFLDKI